MIASYDLRPMPAPLDADLLAKLSCLGTSTLGHWRLWGVCQPAIRPIGQVRAVAGTAVTLALPGADSSLLHHVLDELRPGDILLIDRLGDKHHACIGGVTAKLAKMKGVAAVVVDGPCTDLEEIGMTGLPVWCDGVSATTTRVLGLGGRFNTPICISGVVVQAGDAVLCDTSGVVVLSPQELILDLERARGHAEREASIRRGLDRGQRLDALTGAAALLNQKAK